MSNEKEERAPLLSDEQIKKDWDHPYILEGVKYARDFYEAKITSGELRVNKKTELEPNICDDFYFPSRCKTCKIGISTQVTEKLFDDEPLEEGNMNSLVGPINFCPGCGAEIVKSMTEEAPDPRA